MDDVYFFLVFWLKFSKFSTMSINYFCKMKKKLVEPKQRRYALHFPGACIYMGVLLKITRTTNERICEITFQ